MRHMVNNCFFHSWTSFVLLKHLLASQSTDEVMDEVIVENSSENIQKAQTVASNIHHTSRRKFYLNSNSIMVPYIDYEDDEDDEQIEDDESNDFR